MAQTYASRAKSIMNKYKPRLGDNFDKGDVLSLEAMNQELTSLQDEQEQARADKQVKDQQFQQEAVQTFQDGGKLTKRQTQSVSTLLANSAFTPQSQPQGQNVFAKGGKLPKYQTGGRFTANQYVQQAQQANQGFNQIPYGQQAYPYPQYFGDKLQDQLGAFGQGDFSNPQLGVSPYDLIQGRSPQDPLQRGAQAQAGRFADTTRPGRASLGIDETRPGRASIGINQGQAPLGPTGQIDFPRVQGDEPFGRDGTLGGFQGVSAVDKLGLTYGSSGTSPSGKPAQGQAAQGQAGLPQVATVDPYTDPNIQFDPLSFDTPVDTALPPGVEEFRAQQGQQQQGFDTFQSRVPWWGAAATGLGNILANRQLELPAGENIEDVTAQQIAPRLVDYSRSREQIQRERDRSQAQIRSAARGRGTQQGLTQATIAGATETGRVAGQQFTASQEAQANRNAQIKQATNMFNAQQRTQADTTNLRNAMFRQQLERENQLINAQRRSQQISGVAGAVTQYGQDRISAGQYDQLINMRMADKDFGFQQDDPTFGRRFFGVTDPARIQFNNPNLRVSGN